MKIAVLSSLGSYAWQPLALGLAQGFRALGHDVRALPTNTEHSGRMVAFPTWAARELEAFNPRLVLLGTWKAERAAAIAAIECARRIGARVALWCWDDPMDFETGAMLAPLSDFVFTTCDASAEDYRKSGVSALGLPSWNDPATFRRPAAKDPRPLTVAWVGNARDPIRAPILEAIRARVVDERKGNFLRASVTAPLLPHRVAEVFGVARVAIEIPRDPRPSAAANPFGRRWDHLSPRTHYAIGCGAIPLVIVAEGFADSSKLAADFDGVLPMASPAGAVAALDAILDDPGPWARSFWEKVDRIVLERHAPTVRALQMMHALTSAGVFGPTAKNPGSPSHTRRLRQEGVA
jgi:hypothetical protein